MAISSKNYASVNFLGISAIVLLVFLSVLAHATSSREVEILAVKVEEPQIAFNSENEPSNIKRSDFPVDFLFGASTSSLQTEGSMRSEGRGTSIWDTYIEKHQAKVIDGSSMNISIDSYKRYKEDLEHLKDLGVDAYRFSIPWTRILPNGSLSGGLNQKGINHYNKMIDILVEHGIKPVVTLYHFELPQALEDKYGGFLSSSIVDDFKDYCEFCFKTFGDRVKRWITINEPLIIAKLGYDLGNVPPGRCSERTECAAGNSSTEPYIVTHNLLLSHATVAKLYKEKYQVKQGGEIGISLLGQHYEPYSNSLDDIAARERIMDFELGWFMEPLVYGDYPRIMRELVKDRLPTFTEQERVLVRDSFDFVGINYYSSSYAKSIPIDPNATSSSYTDDKFVNATVEDKDGVLIGPMAEGNIGICIYPKGLQKLLAFIKQKYQSPKIYITENGFPEKRDDNCGFVEALDDQYRIDYIQQHLYWIREAIKNGVNLKGYFHWSLFDSFEWAQGYTVRFGLYYIDYTDNLKRIPKLSALWYHDFLHGDRRQSH